jgi:hypothetical protein
LKHAIYKVVAFRQIRPFELRVEFDDGTSQLIDFAPILRGQIYGPLRDESIFNGVKIDEEAHTLVWPNGADFDPAILHDWPRRRASFERLAKAWDQSAA